MTISEIKEIIAEHGMKSVRWTLAGLIGKQTKTTSIRGVSGKIIMITTDSFVIKK